MQKKNSELFSSILYIIVGLLLAAFPKDSLGIAMTVVGIIFIVSGILELVKNNIGGGIISLIIGVAILSLGGVLLDFIVLVLGIMIAVKGVIALATALGKKNTAVLDIIYPAFTIAVGVMLALGYAVPWIIVIVGVLLAVDGALGLINELKK